MANTFEQRESSGLSSLANSSLGLLKSFPKLPYRQHVRAPWSCPPLPGSQGGNAEQAIRFASLQAQGRYVRRVVVQEVVVVAAAAAVVCKECSMRVEAA